MITIDMMQRVQNGILFIDKIINSKLIYLVKGHKAMIELMGYFSILPFQKYYKYNIITYNDQSTIIIIQLFSLLCLDKVCEYSIVHYYFSGIKLIKHYSV